MAAAASAPIAAPRRAAFSDCGLCNRSPIGHRRLSGVSSKHAVRRNPLPHPRSRYTGQAGLIQSRLRHRAEFGLANPTLLRAPLRRINECVFDDPIFPTPQRFICEVRGMTKNLEVIRPHPQMR